MRLKLKKVTVVLMTLMLLFYCAGFTSENA